MIYHSDLPNPVGREINTSFPDTNWNTAFSCSGFNVEYPSDNAASEMIPLIKSGEAPDGISDADE